MVVADRPDARRTAPLQKEILTPIRRTSRDTSVRPAIARRGHAGSFRDAGGVQDANVGELSVGANADRSIISLYSSTRRCFIRGLAEERVEISQLPSSVRKPPRRFLVRRTRACMTPSQGQEGGQDHSHRRLSSRTPKGQGPASQRCRTLSWSGTPASNRRPSFRQFGRSPKNQTTSRIFLTACASALAVAFAVASPRRAYADDVTPPAVPTNIKVPAGNEAFLVGHAVGTQNYVWLSSGPGVAFMLFTPEATLFQRR
jgi:hypothetical protein